MHRPQEGKALSQRFFFLLQLRQTLDDLAASWEAVGDVPGEEEEDAVDDIMGATTQQSG